MTGSIKKISQLPSDNNFAASDVVPVVADGTTRKVTGQVLAEGVSDILALGNSAVRDVGTASGTVAAGDDSRIVGAAQKASNLSDLTDKAAATNNLLFLQAGTGAVSRSVRAKLRDAISVSDFGATGDGTTDDGPAIVAAATAAIGRTLYFPTPAVAYRCATSLGSIGNSNWRGDGKRLTLIKKDYSGGSALLTLNDGAEIDGIRFDLNGSVRTGDGLKVLNGQGNQTLRDVSIVNGDTAALYFEKDAGSNFMAFNLEAYCVTASNPAVQIENTATGGCPRIFFGFTSAGNKSFSTGGANNLLIANSLLFDIDFSANSFDVAISNCRMAGTSGYTLQGSGSIMGGGIAPAVTIASGAVWNVNPAYTNSTITDNSGGTSIVHLHNIVEYTPTIKAGGVAITLGNGALIGRYSRAGKLVTGKVRFLPGTTTSIGAGQLSVSLPVPTGADLLQVNAQGRLQDTGGTIYYINGQIPATGTEVFLERDTTGSVTGTAPGTLGAGAGLWLQFTYES